MRAIPETTPPAAAAVPVAGVAGVGDRPDPIGAIRSGALSGPSPRPGDRGALPDAELRGGSAAGDRPRTASSEPAAGGAVAPTRLQVLRPGRLRYADGLRLMDALVAERRAGEAPDTLVLLEHEPVVTLGRGADPGHVLLGRARLEARGVELHETGRGGDVTVHNPGQVVGYPVLALQGARRDTHRYLRDLEEVMILAARDFGVRASRADGLTGIWVGPDKLGAIGVRLNSGWITSHGFAFNVCNDLADFDLVVPCGIRGRGVTSLSRLTGREVPLGEAMDRLEERFREVFAAARGPGAGTSPEGRSGVPDAP